MPPDQVGNGGSGRARRQLPTDEAPSLRSLSQAGSPQDGHERLETPDLSPIPNEPSVDGYSVADEMYDLFGTVGMTEAQAGRPLSAAQQQRMEEALRKMEEEETEAGEEEAPAAQTCREGSGRR